MTDASPTPLIVADRVAWRAWLDANEDVSDGVQLVLAKRGVTDPTSLTYAEALDEALCSGWIDGRRNARDASTFLQMYTPRRARSIWSLRNVELVAGLIASGRMRPRGHAEIERARADGRWERAYAGPATAQVPDDLAAALALSPTAEQRFAALGSAERYSVLHPILTAASPVTRRTRIERAVARLDARE